MALAVRRRAGDNQDICVLRGMTPRRGWAGQTCTLYPAEDNPSNVKSMVDGLGKAMAETSSVEVYGSEGARSIVAEVRIVGVDPAGAFASGVFVTDTVFSGE
jgi:hypothetical protein